VTERRRYRLVIAPAARRQLAETLPEAVAFAAHEFVVGPLLDEPHRVGKPLHAPLTGRHAARRGTYRVMYRIDDEAGIVTVLAIMPRGDAYRTP
jgi:mRNA interferase RelE/StbE